MFVFVVLLLAMLERAMFGVVFGVFLSHVRGEFRAVGSTSGFDFGGFFFGEFRDLSDGCLLGFLATLIRVFFGFFFVEFGAADDGIGFGFFRSFFVLGFDETGSECGDLIFV